MPIDSLFAQHIRILSAVEALERLTAGPRPDSIEGLSRSRWTFTRDLMLHFSQIETSIYAPMQLDVRPHAAEIATRASEETARLVADFRAHAMRWRGLPSPERWPQYCEAVRRLMIRIRERLDAEARLLATCLPIQSGAAANEQMPLNPYASQAWEIRSLIYGDDYSVFN